MIAFYKQLIGVLIGVLTGIGFIILMYVPRPVVFFSVLAVILVLLALWYVYEYRSRTDGVSRLLLLMSTLLASLSILTLVEWRLLQWGIVCFAAGVIGLLLYRDGQSVGPGIGLSQKPVRRIKMMLLVYNLYALVTAIFALSMFFPQFPFWILHIIGGVISAGIVYEIWSLYYQASFRTYSLWLIITFLIVSECMWVMHLLPFGYLAKGLFVVWVWYIMQLLTRFHFSERGIVWKNQAVFLSINAILYICALYLTRWV